MSHFATEVMTGPKTDGSFEIVFLLHNFRHSQIDRIYLTKDGNDHNSFKDFLAEYTFKEHDFPNTVHLSPTVLFQCKDLTKEMKIDIINRLRGVAFVIEHDGYPPFYGSSRTVLAIHI